MNVHDSHVIRSSVGSSLIWNSPLGPLRFDLAYALTKDKYDRLQVFRFSGGGEVLSRAAILLEALAASTAFGETSCLIRSSSSPQSTLTLAEVAALVGAASPARRAGRKRGARPRRGRAGKARRPDLPRESPIPRGARRDPGARLPRGREECRRAFPLDVVPFVVADPYRAYARMSPAHCSRRRFAPHRPAVRKACRRAPSSIRRRGSRPVSTVDPGAVIGPDAEIGSGTLIGANAVIGPSVRIGRDCSIGAGASVTHALIGNRVILHAGARIGQDGFGFAMGPQGHLKVPQTRPRHHPGRCRDRRELDHRSRRQSRHDDRRGHEDR